MTPGLAVLANKLMQMGTCAERALGAYDQLLEELRIFTGNLHAEQERLNRQIETRWQENRQSIEGEIASARSIAENLLHMAVLLLPDGRRNERMLHLANKYAGSIDLAIPLNPTETPLAVLMKLQNRGQTLISQADIPAGSWKEFTYAASGRFERLAGELVLLALAAEQLVQKMADSRRPSLIAAGSAQCRQELAALQTQIKAKNDAENSIFWQKAARIEQTARTDLQAILSRNQLNGLILAESAANGQTADASVCRQMIPLGVQLHLNQRSWLSRNGIDLFKDYAPSTTAFIAAPGCWHRQCANNLWLFDLTEGKDVQPLLDLIIYRLIVCSQALSQQFLIFDPVHRGMSFNRFNPLFSVCPPLAAGGISTETTDFESRLDVLCRQMDQTLQISLPGAAAGSYFEYFNSVRGAPPFTAVIIRDFPDSVSDRAIERLIHLAEQGHLAGIDVIVQEKNPLAENEPHQRAELLSRLKMAMTPARVEDKYLIYDRNVTGTYARHMAQALWTTDKLLATYQASLTLLNQKNDSLLPCFTEETFQKASAAEEIVIPLGWYRDGKPANLCFGRQTSQAALLTGAVGSGKSSLLHGIILGLMYRYSKDDVKLFLVDCKNGLEFTRYAAWRLPHLSHLVLSERLEYGLAVLETLLAEMERRAARFKACQATSISLFRKQTGQPCARLLLIIDEFQSLFQTSASRSGASRAAEVMRELIVKGRAFGIHVLLASQSLTSDANLSLSDQTLRLVNIRIGLQQSHDEMVRLFGADNGDDAYGKLDNKRGSAVMTDDYCRKGGLQPLIVGFLEEQDRIRLLTRIQESLRACPAQTRILEHGRLTALDGPEFCRLLNDATDEQFQMPILLGEPFDDTGPCVIRFRNGQRQNLLLAGENKKLMRQFWRLILESWRFGAAQQKGGRLLLIGGKEVNIGQELPEVLRENVATGISWLYDCWLSRRRQAVKEDRPVVLAVMKDLEMQDEWIDMLNGLEDMSEDEAEDWTENGDPLGRLEDFCADLRREMPTGRRMSGKSGRPDLLAMLTRLLMFGYRENIHMLMSVGDGSLIRRELATLIPYFANRLIFDLNESAWNFLTDDPMPKTEATAVFCPGRQESRAIRPYVFYEGGE